MGRKNKKNKRKKILDVEVTFEEAGVLNRPIVSKTDLKGIITYANTPFCKLSGYSKEELIGKPHNIVRHPDMPKAAFKDMWETIEKGKKWKGIVKNLRKDGKYYWVEAFIQPIYDDEGNKIGYISARRPIPDIEKEKYQKLYDEMRKKESN